jgi:glyoxylase-like metal-dependent hydrolase (beta-lactamase superfamily II)
VAYDETLQCIIVDPGCYDAKDNAVLSKFIEENKLKPVALVNTHCHLDHLFGNKFVSDTYQLEPIMHKADLPLLEYAPLTAIQYDLHLDELPEVGKFVEEGDVIHFGNSSFEVLFTPGHAPGHICLLNRDEKIILSADVLFHLSIGRTDLPLGDHATLLKSIKEKLLVLEEDVVVYPGHGPNTSIGFEKKNNPFLQ